ncbi:MAG: hypothetical protein V3S64_10630 [bacterium]
MATGKSGSTHYGLLNSDKGCLRQNGAADGICSRGVEGFSKHRSASSCVKPVSPFGYAREQGADQEKG